MKTLTVGLLIAIILSCAPLQAARSIESLRREALSKEAFESFLPQLERLKPNDDLRSIGRQSSGYWIGKGKNRTLMVVLPGWFESLSGSSLGGLMMFGHLYGREGDTIRGEHVFGYVWAQSNIAPRFLVRTTATTIEEEEFQRLMAAKTDDIGYTASPGGFIFFEDLRVEETRELSFWGIEDEAIEDMELEPIRNAKQVAEEYLSEAGFLAIEPALMSLEPGMDFWTVLSELDGLILTADQGNTHSFLIKGFTYSDDFPVVHHMTDEAVYRILPFGYLKKKRMVPKLIVVFKNGQLQRVVPFTGERNLRKYVE